MMLKWLDENLTNYLKITILTSTTNHTQNRLDRATKLPYNYIRFI